MVLLSNAITDTLLIDLLSTSIETQSFTSILADLNTALLLYELNIIELSPLTKDSACLAMLLNVAVPTLRDVDANRLPGGMTGVIIGSAACKGERLAGNAGSSGSVR